jgi:hypothetical protein
VTYSVSTTSDPNLLEYISLVERGYKNVNGMKRDLS